MESDVIAVVRRVADKDGYFKSFSFNFIANLHQIRYVFTPSVVRIFTEKLVNTWYSGVKDIAHGISEDLDTQHIPRHADGEWSLIQLGPHTSSLMTL